VAAVTAIAPVAAAASVATVSTSDRTTDRASTSRAVAALSAAAAATTITAAPAASGLHEDGNDPPGPCDLAKSQLSDLAHATRTAAHAVLPPAAIRAGKTAGRGVQGIVDDHGAEQSSQRIEVVAGESVLSILSM